MKITHNVLHHKPIMCKSLMGYLCPWMASLSSGNEIVVVPEVSMSNQNASPNPNLDPDSLAFTSHDQ